MPDIRDVLRGAAPEVADPDVEGIARRARSRRAVPRALVACAVVIAVIVGTVVVVTRDGSSPGRIDSGTTPSAPTTAPVPTGPPTTTATTVPPTPTFAPGEDRLSADSRLGYAGLGPIKLGMSFDDAVAAAHVAEGEPTGCDIILYGALGSGVDSITVWGRPTIDTITVLSPGLRTISGIEVGDTRADVLATYPSATPRAGPYPSTWSPSALVITNGEGASIVFAFGADGDAVQAMVLTSDLTNLDRHATC